MRIRTAIVTATLLLGGAATTFAGDRRIIEVRGDHREVIVRHDEPVVVRHDRDFRHDHDVVIRNVPGPTIICDR